MQTLEHDSAVVSLPATHTGDVPRSSYEAVRYNAMKHVILSRYTVLSHKDVGKAGIHLTDTKNGTARDMPLSTHARKLLHFLEVWGARCFQPLSRR